MMRQQAVRGPPAPVSQVPAPLNEFLRDRILRKLDGLSDERLYQVLDYVEFLDSRYAERQAPPPNAFTKFVEGVEDTMRAGRISATTIAETTGLLNKAVGVLSGVAAAGKSVANDLVGVASKTSSGGTVQGSQPAAPVSGAGGGTTPTPQSPPAPQQPPAPQHPPSGERPS